MVVKIQNVAYVHNRGLGDYVINRFVRRQFNIRFTNDIIANYIHPLHTAMGLSDYNTEIDYNTLKTPDFFNIRNSRIIDVYYSILKLRSQLAKLRQQYPDYILFCDHKRKLQDFILGTKTITPSRLDNVYLSHLEFYKSLGFEYLPCSDERLSVTSDPQVVKIFPYSSSPTKNFKNATISEISNVLKYIGIDFEVIYLAGEHILDKSIPYSVVDKTFEALISEIKNSKFLISCDSLPAHLGNYYGKNVISLLPRMNHYWLPFQTYKTNSFLFFEDIQVGFRDKLCRKIDNLL